MYNNYVCMYTVHASTHSNIHLYYSDLLDMVIIVCIGERVEDEWMNMNDY